jgi:hypothetical protein
MVPIAKGVKSPNRHSKVVRDARVFPGLALLLTCYIETGHHRLRPRWTYSSHLPCAGKPGAFAVRGQAYIYSSREANLIYLVL